jgi:hypothetical protein
MIQISLHISNSHLCFHKGVQLPEDHRGDTMSKQVEHFRGFKKVQNPPKKQSQYEYPIVLPLVHANC